MKRLTKSKSFFLIITVTSLISHSPLWCRTPTTKCASSILLSLNPATWYKSCRQNYCINMITSSFHIRIVHLDIINVFYSPTDAQVNCLETILKFTLKHFRHVSVQLHHHQVAHFLGLLKLQLLK